MALIAEAFFFSSPPNCSFSVRELSSPFVKHSIFQPPFSNVSNTVLMGNGSHFPAFFSLNDDVSINCPGHQVDLGEEGDGNVPFFEQERAVSGGQASPLLIVQARESPKSCQNWTWKHLLLTTMNKEERVEVGVVHELKFNFCELWYIKEANRTT